MALEGTFKDFPASDIFQLIGLQKKTGVLSLESGNRQIKIFLSGGKLIWAEDNQRNPEARLGQLLVNSGKIQKEQLEEALSRQSQTRQRLGSILLQMNCLRGQELEKMLERQVVETAFQVFRWKDGRYQFSAQRNPDPREHLIAPLPLESILLDAMRMLDEWPLIEDKIPSFEDRLCKATRLPNNIKDKLGEEDWIIFNSVNGIKTVREIIDASPVNEFDTCKTIAGLIGSGFLTVAIPPVESVPKEVMPSLGRAGQGVLPRRGPFLFLFAIAFAWIILRFLVVPAEFSSLIPFAHPREKNLQLARIYQAKWEIERWHDAIRHFYAESGNWPPQIHSLSRRWDVRPRDPWGNEYLYQTTPNGFRLTSSGKDRIIGTKDDIERREPL